MIKIKNRFFFILAFSMGLVVALSNYLVQFPITYMSLEEIFTYGAFSYPVAFLITDLANRRYGKEIEKNKKVSIIEPINEEVKGAINHFLFLKWSKTWTSISWAIKKAVPDPTAILIDTKSE